MSNAIDSLADIELRFTARAAAEPSTGSMVDRIARLSGAPPLYVLPRVPGTRLSAAWWRFDGRTTLRLNPADEIVLGFRASGSATVLRTGVAGSLRKRPSPGAVSLVDPSRNTEWLIDGTCEVLHVYIPRASLQAFSPQSFATDLGHVVREFVGVRNRWLGAYFQMLAAEMELTAATAGTSAPSFLAETEALLMRHLIDWRAAADDIDLDAPDRGRPVPALRKPVLRRVQDFVEANLRGEIHLGQLAAVACMSEDHFLRSFRAACGTTPYQYVIEQRVGRAAAMLKGTSLPIGEIARACGFKSAPQLCLRFRAVMGMRPSSYRASARS